jgi:hypothetical protein
MRLLLMNLKTQNTFFILVKKVKFFFPLSLLNIDKPVKSPKLRRACEGRHPEPFENTGFPPSRE